MNADSGLNVTEIVLEAGSDNFVVPTSMLGIAVPGIPAHPMEREYPYSGGERLAERGDHSSLSSSHVLSRVKTEAYCVADAGITAAPMACPGNTCRRRARHLRRPAGRRRARRQMTSFHKEARPDGLAGWLSAGRDGFLDLSRIDIAVRPHIRQDRFRPGLKNGVHRRAERKGRGDHLVAFAHTQRSESGVQSRRAGIDGDRVRRANVAAELLLKLRGSWSSR